MNTSQKPSLFLSTFPCLHVPAITCKKEEVSFNVSNLGSLTIR